MHTKIKRILAILLSFVMLLGMLPAVYAADRSLSQVVTDPQEDMPELTLPNGDFETGDATNWVLTGLPENPVRQNEWNEPNTSWTLNLWANDNEAVEIHAQYPVKLTAGTYKFSFFISGEGKDSQLKWKVLSGETTLIEAAETVTTVDWNVWNTVETDSFTLTEPTEVVFDFGGTGPVKYWGDLDDLKLFGTGAIVSEGPDHEPTIAVEKVNGVDSDDFMRGTDVSSYLSIVNSGAVFYDYEGNPLDNQGFFDLLAEAGFNYIRLRVWNDPFDADDNGYGGGNCDVNAALQMGQWATNAGMKVLIDFHYSDFWADPGKQKAPKAWSGYTVDQKAAAVDEFTYNSLKTLLDGGVNVGMVQVGNETTNSICGESAWANKAKIFSAGSAAVRRISAEYEHPILVAIHFTNPERSGNYASQAKNLNDYNVDYDVFASSWYPYWHGTTANLTSVLKQVADTYGKQVVVAETSWAWTLDDGDGHENTVRVGNNDGNAAYAFSQQGQADELVSAAKAVTAVGSAGVGVFYWENAWIPVQYAYDENGTLDQTILASNKAKWEEFGSGWASSYAAEYDPTDAGVWFGGSAVDNQAMFDFTGKALDSLWTWEYMMTGTEEAVEQEIVSIEAPELVFEQGATLSLPSEIAVTYLVGGVAYESVTWDQDDISDVDMNTPGIYQVHGVVSTQLGDREIVATVTVNYPNLLLNPSFEEADMSMYTYENGSRTGDDPHTGSRSFHFYNAAAKTVKLEQSITLEPGTYSFSLFAQGDAKGSEDIYIYVKVGDSEPVTQSFTLAGWAVWQNPEVEFEVTEAVTVTVGLHLAFGAGGWGTVDDLSLHRSTEAPAPVSPVYYLVGSMNNWTAEEAYKLTAGENAGEFVLTGVALEAGTTLKIVDAVNEAWYPDGVGNDYTVTENGTYDVSFYPAGEMGEAYHYGYFKLTKQGEQPPEPETAYYLFGWINNADYPAEGLGDYKFTDGKLTATFEEDSYVAVQTNTGKQYMTAGWLGNVNTATLYDKTTISNPDKLKVPGGVELEFTLTVNDDGTLTLSYTGADVPQPQDPVYYLVGSMNDWTADEAYKLTAGENEGEFVLTGVALEAGAEVKVKDEPNDLWYPNGGNYVVAEAGTYDVSFYPAGTDLEGYTEGVLKLTKQGPCPTGHAYGAPEWTWNADNTAATAKFTCASCGDVQTLDAEITETVLTEAKPHVAGEKKLTATVTFEGNDYTDEKTVAIEAQPCPCADFEDMPEYGTPEHEAIDWAFENGITAGLSATEFGTNKTLNRAQAATFLYAAADKPAVDSTATLSFNDVVPSNWYYTPVLWASTNGLVTGYGDNTFKPNNALTRAQILTILYAWAGKPAVDEYTNPYSDVVAKNWYYAPAVWAYSAGIEKGENGKFAQGTLCTRATFVLYLYRHMTGNCLLED